VHDFVTTDPRYANFVKTCNEWRVGKAQVKVMPWDFDDADLNSHTNMLALSCGDRQSDYKASNIVAVPPNTIMSVSDSKVKLL